MYSRAISGCALAGLFVAAVLGADDPSETVTTQKTSRAFAKPLIALTIMSDADDLVLLQQPEERALGERRFLVGEGVDDGQSPDWRNGRTVWIAIDDIQQIVEFDNVESFRDSLQLKKGEGRGKAASRVTPPANGSRPRSAARGRADF